MPDFKQTGINRYRCGDWEVHYSPRDDEHDAEYGQGWVRDNHAKRLRRFIVNRGRVRWWNAHHGLQLVSRNGLVTYGPFSNTDVIEPVVRDFLDHAFNAEIE